MVRRNRNPYYYSEYNIVKDISFLIAISKIFLAMVILVGLLVILDIFVYLGVVGGRYDGEVKAAYDSSYDEGYTQTYTTGYREAYGSAYSEGYLRGLEISKDCGSRDGTGSLVILRIPEYKELQAFLADDNTDSNQYIADEYTCFDYAADLNNSAESIGIRAAYVSIRSRKWAHALVAFDTIDKGLVYIEPQSDREVELTIGKPYPWWKAGASSPVDAGYPVEEIQIIW